MSRPALLALLLLAAPALAQQRPADDPAALLRTVVDEAAPLERREEALARVTGIAAQQRPPRTGALRDALLPLLDRLAARRADPAWTRLTVLALRATELFRPLLDLTARLRPLLDLQASQRLREAAVRAVTVHGTPGLAGELEALLRSDGPADRERTRFDRTIVDAAQALEAPEAARVLAAALQRSTERGVRLPAARALGEKRAEPGRRALLEACRVEEKDELVACEAALSLGRYGTLDGAGALVARLQVRQGSLEVYVALCRVALREDEGFGGVRPGDYYEAGREGRARAIQAAVAWWEGARPRSAEDALFDRLAARGVAVPADRRGKDAVAAMIEALSLDPRSLRYAALDRLVELTGRQDLGDDFRVLQRSLNGPAAIREPEPDGGFQDAARQEALRQQQARKQAAWRAWWAGARQRAELVQGRWVVPG